MATHLVRILVAMVCTPLLLVADPNGKTGRTSTTSAGCGSCHGASPKPATTVSYVGPHRVVAGSTHTLTVIVSHPTHPRAGVGIAVRTSQTGSTPSGTLNGVQSTGLRLRGTEITQSSPQPLSDGSVQFTFTWTAPSEPGVAFVQAVGNAVNGNGNDDANDAWNWLDPVPITIETATSVEDSHQHILDVFPNPYREGILTLGLHSEQSYEVTLIDIMGRAVFRASVQGSPSGVPILPPALPRGTYWIVMQEDRTVRRTPLIID